MSRSVNIVEYDPGWPEQFGEIRNRIWPCVCDLALGIEHVGSTSVPGLAAKPIIDIDIVIAARGLLPRVDLRLAALGYQHQGNLGIDGRDSFIAPSGPVPHNLYVCLNGSAALRNHLTLRDHLRAHPPDSQNYAVLKKSLAERFPKDIDQYVEGKTNSSLLSLRGTNLQPKNSSPSEERIKLENRNRRVGR